VLKAIIRRGKTELPTLPKGTRVYAVGDIHGRVDLLNKVFKRIDADAAGSAESNAVEIYLGDYIDRGPASREVLDHLIARSRTHKTVFLKGNHETYPFEFLNNPAFLREWGQLGGLETLMSYGLRPPVNAGSQEQIEIARAFDNSLPAAHRSFLENLRPFVCYGDFYFVHAGVRPGVALERQQDEDLLEIRDVFLNCEDDLGKIIVHGHTPVFEPEFRPNRINIDTGAYATGRLTCLAIGGDQLRLV
jgi:serine/threonine protein phosphatase 1